MAQDILQAWPVPSAARSVFQKNLVADFLEFGDLAVAVLF
jgi:hypothetical protein